MQEPAVTKLPVKSERVTTEMTRWPFASLPEGADTNTIEATFSKGVLKVMVPKTAEAQKAEKKIAVKAA